MKVLAFTSIRSEYDLMSSLFKFLNEDSAIELKLLVGGTHHSPSFGMTVDNIKDDGFDVLEVESLIDGDTASSRLKSASVLLLSAIDLVKGFAPDLIIYAGDREEVLIGAMIGGYLGIPTVHFFGGDHASDGHIDNPVRHATTKLSTFHFVSTREHKNRVLALGESERRVFNVGSVALDKFYEIKGSPSSLSDIAKKDIVKPGALFIFHPVESEVSIAAEIVRETVVSLIDEGFHVFIGKPNSDHGNSLIRSEIDRLSLMSDVTVYGNLPRVEFIQLFKGCSVIIGNSSAGLLESASIPIPCINIGERQKGRLCAENVVFVEASRPAVSDAIRKIKSADFHMKLDSVVNPYGSGNSSKLAFELIKTLDLECFLNKAEDPLCNG